MSIKNLETNSSNYFNISCSCFACIPPNEMILGNSTKAIDFSFYPETIMDFTNATVTGLKGDSILIDSSTPTTFANGDIITSNGTTLAGLTVSTLNNELYFSNLADTNINYDESGIVDGSIVYYSKGDNAWTNITQAPTVGQVIQYQNQDPLQWFPTSTLTDQDSKGSIDIFNRYALDATGSVSVSYGNRFLVDSTGITSSLGWDERQLFDSTGTTTSIDYQNRLLDDSTGNTSINYQNRLLINTSGSTVLNYSTGVAIPSLSANQVVSTNRSSQLVTTGLTLTSNTYTPTVTNISNLSAITVVSGSYMRINSQIQVNINFNCTLAATTTCSFTISLPIVTASFVGSGICCGSTNQLSGSGILTGTPNQFITYTCSNLITGTPTISCSFMYQM